MSTSSRLYTGVAVFLIFSSFSFQISNSFGIQWLWRDNIDIALRLGLSGILLLLFVVIRKLKPQE